MSSPFTPSTIVGQNAGNRNKQNFNANVQSIRVWSANGIICGIQLSYNEGFDVKIGIYLGSDKTLSLDMGERIASLTMWPTTDAKNVAAIRITTSKDQVFQHGDDPSPITLAFVCPVGSGIMTGVEVCYTTAVTITVLTGIGFYFFQPIQSMAVTNLKYINPPAVGSTDGVNLISLSQGTFTNNTSSEIDYVFQDSVTKTTSQTYETAATQQWGVDVTVEAGFLDFAKVSTTVSWSMTTEKRMSSTTELAIALQWSIQGKLPGKPASGPASTVNCKASCWQGIISVDYTADVTITFQDSSIVPVTYTSAGTANNVLYGFVTADSNDSSSSSPAPAEITSLQESLKSKLLDMNGYNHADKLDVLHHQMNGTLSEKNAQMAPVAKFGLPVQRA